MLSYIWNHFGAREGLWDLLLDFPLANNRAFEMSLWILRRQIQQAKWNQYWGSEGGLWAAGSRIIAQIRWEISNWKSTAISLHWSGNFLMREVEHRWQKKSYGGCLETELSFKLLLIFVFCHLSSFQQSSVIQRFQCLHLWLLSVFYWKKTWRCGTSDSCVALLFWVSAAVSLFVCLIVSHPGLCPSEMPCPLEASAIYVLELSPPLTPLVTISFIRVGENIFILDVRCFLGWHGWSQLLPLGFLSLLSWKDF